VTPIALEELAQRLGGDLILPLSPQGAARGETVTGFATDSREVKPGDLFIAIRGAQVDGHAFVEAAFANGAAAALVERPVSGPHIRVYSVVATLARMARSFRDEFHGPVIGISGSAGKSSCKEFVAAALSPLSAMSVRGEGVGGGEPRILKTEGNRNTEYTAPLLWAELHSPSPSSMRGGEPAAVVVEMGMRGPGQIAHLASFSKPTIAIITNIGFSHLSELGSREAIAQAKGEILEALPPDGTAILWAEDEYLLVLKEIAARVPDAPPPSPLPAERRGGGRRLLTFGFTSAADAQVVSYRATGWESAEIEIAFGGEVYRATLPVVGRHQALNAAAAFLAAVAAGVQPTQAAEALKDAKLPPMRMAVRERGDVTFVLDMYNASPPSVIAALETVRDVIDSSSPPPSPLPAHRHRGEGEPEFIAVLGEMRELGEHTEQGHRDVGEALVRFGVDRVILLAPDVGTIHPTATIRAAAIGAGMLASLIHVASSHEEVKTFLEELVGPSIVLVKGSRGVELERALPEGLL